MTYSPSLKAVDAPTQKLWQQTPLIRSAALSERTGHDVYLKIETFQTSGSFKGRGVSHFANQATKSYLEQHYGSGATGGRALDTQKLAMEASMLSPNEWMVPFSTSHVPEDGLPHLVIASGGNAGLAAASAAGILGVKCTVFVPAAQAGIEHLFTRHGKNGSVRVRVGGENYRAALAEAIKFAEELGDKGILIPAYDDPLVWQGNSSLAHEIAQQLPKGVQPDAIFCSVGGGGMIAGLMLGCETIPGWDQVPIVALEPSGTACFYHSIQANREQASTGVSHLPKGAKISLERVPPPSVYLPPALRGQMTGRMNEESYSVAVVHLPAILSRASSLGASSAAPGAVSMALKRRGAVNVVTVSDERAMHAARMFADDHSVITELGCSVTLTPAYAPTLLNRVLESGCSASLEGPRSNGINGQNGNNVSTPSSPRKVLVFIVCGGSKGSIRELGEFGDHLASWDASQDEIWVDGTRL